MTQVSYARRLIGHKYFPFMNYQMPEHVYAGANPRLKRLLGFCRRALMVRATAESGCMCEKGMHSDNSAIYARK
jgi:hypothetical protein